MRIVWLTSAQLDDNFNAEVGFVPRTGVVIQKALSADHDVEVAETSRRSHATRLAQGAAAAGFVVARV